jgi:hypothetical protein
MAARRLHQLWSVQNRLRRPPEIGFAPPESRMPTAAPWIRSARWNFGFVLEISTQWLFIAKDHKR